MKSKYLLFALLAMASCTQEEMPGTEEMQKPEANVNGKYQAVLPGFVVESAGHSAQPQSRVGINNTMNGFTWQSDDYIGIFPKSNKDGGTLEGDQVYFNIIPDPASNDGSSASFDGGGWQAKEGYSYWAYCPFNREGGFGQNKTAMHMDFTNQVWNKDNNYLSKRVYMLSEGTVDNSKKNFTFDFKALTCLGICNLHMPSNHQGYITSLIFEMLDPAVKPFVEIGTFDLTKAAGIGEDLPVEAITITTPNHKFTLIAPTEEGNRFEFGSDQSQLDKQWLFSQAALQNIAGKTCRVSVKFISTKSETQGVETTYFTDFTFSKDWVPGHAYVFDLSFPAIDRSTNYILVDKPGSLRPSQVQTAMNGSSKLVVNGTLNDKDFDVLRDAAVAGAQATSRAAGATILTDLDLAGVEFDASMVTEGKVNFPLFNGTQLTRIVMPRKGANLNLQANTFNAVPLATFEWDLLGGVAYEGIIDPQAFEGCTTTNCDLKISPSFFSSLSLGADKQMLFAGKEFKSYTKRTESPSGEVKDEELNAVTVDAQSHTITTIVSGFMIEQNVTDALAGGTDLTVVGPIKGDDFWWIRRAVINKGITTLNLSKATIEAGETTHKSTNSVGETIPFQTEANALPIRAFNGSGLTTIQLPENLKIIGDCTFMGCKDLSSIEIPANVTTLGKYVFNRCVSLSSVTFSGPSQVETLPREIFRECSSLKSFTIPASMKHIGLNAFYQTGLESIVLPATLVGIETNSFAFCGSLQSVTIEGDLKWDVRPDDPPHSSQWSPFYYSGVYGLDENRNTTISYPDLIISEALSNQVTVGTNGELMFMMSKWKSVKDFNGKNIIDSPQGNFGDVNNGGTIY